jgi:hypothetical protein
LLQSGPQGSRQAALWDRSVCDAGIRPNCPLPDQPMTLFFSYFISGTTIVSSLYLLVMYS